MTFKFASAKDTAKDLVRSSIDADWIDDEETKDLLEFCKEDVA